MSTRNLTWSESETHDEGASTFYKGYAANVYPSGEGEWFWRVDLTRAISEYPECYDCGTAPSCTAAMLAANACLDKATKVTS